MATGIWALWQDTPSGDTVLQHIVYDAGSWTTDSDIACPEALTNATSGPLHMSTCVLRSWPVDRNIVYFAGRSDVDGHLKAWRYDHNVGEFTQLLDVEATSGTWPFATGLWLSHSLPERAWLVSGNGSGWSVFNNQNVDGAQGVWYSEFAGDFTSYGYALGNPYSGSNINHPNSLQDIRVDESTDPPKITVSHSPTADGGVTTPNSYPHWSLITETVDNGINWVDVPHPTGLKFLAGWVGFISNTPDSTFLANNGSPTGAYSFADTNFGTEPVAGEFATTGEGPYGHNTIDLCFPDGDGLVAFWSNQGQIDIHAARAGAVTSTFTDASWGSFTPTACRVADTGGVAIALCEDNTSPCAVVIVLDYGDSVDFTLIADRAGLAVDFAPEETPPPPVHEVLRESLTFYDDRMFTVRTGYYVASDSAAEATLNAQGIAGLVEALSNAHLVIARGPWNLPPVVPVQGSDDTYNMAESVLRFVFLTDNATPINLDVPCPTSAALLDDQELYAILNPAVADLTTQAISYRLANRGGLEATLFVGAQRLLRPRRSVQNVRTLDPTVTSESE